jgi:hypothetical protein
LYSVLAVRPPIEKVVAEPLGDAATALQLVKLGPAAIE